jgi:hypothetical protein
MQEDYLFAIMVFCDDEPNHYNWKVNYRGIKNTQMSKKPHLEFIIILSQFNLLGIKLEKKLFLLFS